jgi:hypothetical protein
MKPATISDIKKALTDFSYDEVVKFCLTLAKYKSENKELLSYLVFEADDPQLFLKKAKKEVDRQFSLMNHTNVYLAKKTIRKILQTVNRYIRFSGSKQMEVELLIYFCQSMKESGLPFRKHPVTENMYLRQLAKIDKALSKLHEDLQYDYGVLVKEL